MTLLITADKNIHEKCKQLLEYHNYRLLRDMLTAEDYFAKKTLQLSKINIKTEIVYNIY